MHTPLLPSRRLRHPGSTGFPLLAVLALGVACPGNTAELHGQVVDLRGQPLAAEVQIVGQRPTFKTGADGSYRLPYVPGHFEVRVSAEGYIPITTPWDLYTEATVEAAPITLILEPPGEGLWAPGEGAYSGVQPGVLLRQVESPLGLASAQQVVITVEGPALSICVGETLILVARGEHVSVWRLEAGRQLWRETVRGREGQVLSDWMTPVGGDRWRIDLKEPGDVAVAGGSHAWALEVQRCP